ncbi:hypothetical protein DENSPDRAFT_835352 [Dentipellis sp. KUC8613]|nr:hypothetical protein DENSPDRAFT_835352 [Dentipellis sp. KUC8613]
MAPPAETAASDQISAPIAQDSAPTDQGSTETHSLTVPEPTYDSGSRSPTLRPQSDSSLATVLPLRSDSLPPGYSRVDIDATMRMPKHVYSPSERSSYVPPAILPMSPGPSATQRGAHNADANTKKKQDHPRYSVFFAGRISISGRAQSPRTHKGKHQQAMNGAAAEKPAEARSSQPAPARAMRVSSPDPELQDSTSRAGREQKKRRGLGCFGWCCKMIGNVCLATLYIVLLPVTLVVAVLDTILAAVGALFGCRRPGVGSAV